MSVRPKACVEITCDGGGCTDAWEDGTPHFPTEAEAVSTARSYGWVVVGPRALCPACAAQEGCAITGHQWSDRWHDGNVHGVAYRSRYCDNCGDRQYDPPFDALSALADAARIVNGTETDA